MPLAQIIEDLSDPYVICRIREKRGRQWRLLYQDRFVRAHYKDTARRRTNRLELYFDNRDMSLFGDDVLMRKGSEISFTFGYPSRDRDAGIFVIKGHDASANLKVTCHERKRNKLGRLTKARYWEDAKRSEVVRLVLLQSGIPSASIEIDESALALPIITQTRESDLQLIERLAREEHKEFWLDKAGAHWVEPKRGQKPVKRFKVTKGLIGAGEITGYPKIESFGAGVPGRITLRGIDPLSGEEYTVHGDENSDGLILLADTDDLETIEEGDAGARGNSGYEITRNVGSRSKAEAQILADSIYKEYRYGALKMKLPVRGDPWHLPRTITEIWGYGPFIDGYFWVKQVDHDIGARGFFKSELTLNKDGLNRKGKPKQKSEPVTGGSGDVPNEIARGNIAGARKD